MINEQRLARVPALAALPAPARHELARRGVVARRLTSLRRAGAIASGGRGAVIVANRARLERIAQGEPV